MKILINNSYIEKDDAQISIFSEALMYGYGIFETFRTYPGKKILKLDTHISRLINSASQIELQLNYNFEAIQKFVYQIVEESDHELLRIKILAVPDYLIIISNELTIDKKIYKGIFLKTSIHNRSMPEIKSISYLDCFINYNQAIKQGFFDTLFIDKQNHVYECTRSNIFWIKNGKLYTRQNKVLPGIIREFIIKNSNIPFEYFDGNLSNLFDADEVFVTNSIIGIVPVIKIDNSNISSGQAGIETSKLMRQLKRKCHNLPHPGPVERGN